MANYVSNLTVQVGDNSSATYNIRELFPHVGTCSTAAATAAKEVTIGNFKLYTGAWVVVKFNNTNSAAVASLTLNVDGTGAKPIKYRNANLDWAGQLISNRYTYFIYDGANYQIVSDFNSDTYDRTSHQTRIYAGTIGVFNYSLCAMDNNQRMQSFTTTSGTGTAKTFNTSASFMYPPVIMYNAANSTYADGTAIANNVLYEQYPSVDLRYSCNVTSTAGFTQYKPVYLECTINSDGTFKLTTTGLTQTFTNGKYYILLGCMYNTSIYQLALFAQHPMFYYDGTHLNGIVYTAAEKTKLSGIANGATKVESSSNGKIKINGKDTTVYSHPTHTAASSGLYKITVDTTGHVSATAAVAKGDIPALDYLPLSGGTMTGTLTAKASQYADEYSGALNMNNSNIYGVNSIYTADVADGAAEGIHFYRDTTHVDTLWMTGGSLLFVPNRELGTNTTAANSQKVARFTTNPTTGQVVITDGTAGGIKSSGYTIAKSVPSNAVFTDHITTVTSSGSGNAVTAISADANGALTVTKGSTFSLSTHTHNYAGSSSAGGPATNVELPRVTADSKSFPGQNKVGFREYSNTSTNTPSSAWYHIISMQGADTKYGTQLALGMTTNAVYYRNYNNQNWIDWQPLGRFTATPTSGQVVVADGTTGGIKSSGYTIAKSVPSDAKFSDTVTTVTTSGSGNAVTSITASNGALTVTKGSTFSLSTHKHGLLHSDLNQASTNGTTGGWSVIGIDPAVTGYVLKSIRVNQTSPNWLSGDYGAGIAFGGFDTKGVISMKYLSPVITFAGGNHNSSKTEPVWYLKISGTSGSTYNLANFYDSTISRTANTVLAAPNGSNGEATFRKLVAADIPYLNYSGVASSWWNDRDNAVIRLTKADSSYRPLWSLLTSTTGSWAVGNHNNDDLVFNFISKATYDTGSNPASDAYKQVKFTNAGGITTTGAITASGTGTFKTGDFGTQLIVERTGGANMAGITFKNTSGVLGYIAANTVNGDLYHYGATDPSTMQYTILDSHNYTSYPLPRNIKHVHTASGTEGSAGWVKIARITVTNLYANHPMTFTIAQRGIMQYRIHLVLVNNGSVAAAAISQFIIARDNSWTDTNNNPRAYIIKPSDGIFDLYIRKTEAYDHIFVVDFTKADGSESDNYSVTWTNVHAADSAITGGTEAVKKLYLSTSGGTMTGELKQIMQLRIYSGNYGTIFRNDGTDTYFLLTESGSAESGSWNSLRPLYFSNSTGKVTIGNGLTVYNGITGDLTGNVTGNCSGSSGSCTGNATTATTAGKLSNTSAIGSSTQPVYFNKNGVPVACTQDANQAHFSTVPFVKNDGVMEVGRYFDMHSTNTGTSDYDVRLDASGVSSFRFTFNTPASSSIAPSTNNQTSLGTSSLKWSNVYATTFYGALSGNASTATKLETARNIALAEDFAGSANFDGSGNISISGTFYRCSASSNNTANYPWHRIAYRTGVTDNYNDTDAIFMIRACYNGGPFGIIKVAMRTNGPGTNCQVAARWVVRQNIAANDVYIAQWGKTGQSVYADIFLKGTTYNRAYVYQIAGSRSWTLVNSAEAIDTTTSDKKTSTEVYASIAAAGTTLHNQAYTQTVAGIDEGHVNSANSATYATRANYLDVVAGNEVRFYNNNQVKEARHFWLGYSWADGSHYTPSGGSDTSSTTAPNITKFVMGDCSGGGLTSVHAKTFILGNGSSPTLSSKTTTITTAATTTDRTITLPDDSGTVALTSKTFSVTRGSSKSTATTGYWAAMCNSTQAGSPTLPTAVKWWHVISMDWTNNDTNNWISQLAIATQDGSGVWWRRNNASGTSIDSSSWHRLAEGNSSGAATNIATEEGNAAGARPVFYAYLGDNTRVVYNTSFTYNPSGNVLKATTFDGEITTLAFHNRIYALSQTPSGSTWNGNETLITSIPSASGTSTPNYQRVKTIDFVKDCISGLKEPVLYENTTNPSTSTTIQLPNGIPKYLKVFIGVEYSSDGSTYSDSSACINCIDVDMAHTRHGGFIGYDTPGQSGVGNYLAYCYVNVKQNTGSTTAYTVGISYAKFLNLATSAVVQNIIARIVKIIAVY